MKKPDIIHTVDEIQVVEARGPWASKSGGELNVLFALTAEQLQAFLNFDNPAFADVPQDIRGLRSYTVSDIPEGSVGAQEVHLARTELVIALGGSASWTCVDLYGGEKEFTLDSKTSVILPPGILHTYRALEDNTRLQVVANTLFIPDDPRTHDSYSMDEFYAVQREMRS